MSPPWYRTSVFEAHTSPLLSAGHPDAQLVAAIILGVATVAYTAYHLAITPPSVRRFFPTTATTDDHLKTQTAWFRKVLGAVLFTAVSLSFGLGFGLPLGLTLDHLDVSLLWTALPYATLLPVLWMQSRKPSFQQHYPEVRHPFDNRTHALNALAWAAYLIGYELFFRGLLVIALAPLIGPWPALAASLMGYVFAHLHKYPGEAVGSLFTGLGFSLVALETQSLVQPIVLHLLLALTTDELTSRARARATRGATA
jgi:membrane protease YdiL (CAAX protease family)